MELVASWLCDRYDTDWTWNELLAEGESVDHIRAHYLDEASQLINVIYSNARELP
jgi:hypothetical protein